MSEAMREFLTEWYEWAINADESEDHVVFTGHVGLCASLTAWVNIRGGSPHDKADLRNELTDMFWVQGLDYVYPFGAEHYIQDRREYTQHKCPVRLLWVAEQLGIKR
jgi:hypothetical protein